MKGLAFSPDATKIAVAQSDNIVFIYKIGTEWGDKKSICNKFQQQSPVTAVIWPSKHPHEIVFGLGEGKVKIGNTKTHRPATLYSTDSLVVSLAVSPDGTSILSGHADGSIYRFHFGDGGGSPNYSKFATHAGIPYALSWGQHIMAAGSDKKVVFYDKTGEYYQTFDYQYNETEKEFLSSTVNPSGMTVVVGSFNHMRIFSYNPRLQKWEEDGEKQIDNVLSISALCWKPDGSRLAMGSARGSVDLYDACIRRYRYAGKFEFTYVSLSQVVVKRLATGTRIVLKSHFDYEITKINVFQDKYLVAHTPETLLLGDLAECRLSEVPWSGSGNERFYFENAAVCMIFNAGELSLVEYGRNDILGSCRTEYMNPHLISLRMNERGDDAENKKIAYLVDVQTIRILDLESGITVGSVNHDAKIDWLELNGRASKLLFRDKQHQLHLYDIKTQERSTLLNYCSYVQWVPDSDVVVAQNRGSLCVWYHIDRPERVTIFPIKGDVEEIERTGGKTEVIVDEGISQAAYQLDEALIQFGTAVDDKDYERAVDLLEQLELSPETEAMWQNLSELAVSNNRLHIAERCYAALGDVSRARYVRKVHKIAKFASQELGGDGTNHFMVRAKLMILEKQFQKAEEILLDQGQVEEAMEMYQELHRWDDTIAVAERKHHPEVENLRRNYFQWLLETGQEDKAGELKERENDLLAAINLYLKGSMPAKAAQIVNTNPHMSVQQDVLERIAAALNKSGMYERAGEFFEKLNMNERALAAYTKGHCFRRAVDISRRVFPAQVVRLEEEWGDWMVSQKQLDGAINHYIEAGQNVKAIDAAIQSMQWAKAVQIVEAQGSEVARPFYDRIAAHFEQIGTYEVAEKYYVKASKAHQAVEMYCKVGKWDRAHKVAVSHMNEGEIEKLYSAQAEKLQAQGNMKGAERLFITINEPDLAINMYKKHRQYDNMVRLVAIYHRDLLLETHLHLAQQLEAEGNFKQAEVHYVEATEWKSAVNMYRTREMWDDALRVAKISGGEKAQQQVAYAWALFLGGEAGAKLLKKLGLIEQAITYASENCDFHHAFELAKSSMKSMIPEVHFKHALFLEDEGRFKEAEDEFIAAGKPKEAIDMYKHQEDWASAARVAETYIPSAASDVMEAEANAAAAKKDYSRAEALYLRAKKPEVAIRKYKEVGMWNDAIRVCKGYLPMKLNELNAEYASHKLKASDAGNMDKGDVESTASVLEKQGEYSRAVDMYLKVKAERNSDLDYCEEIWEKAVNVAMDHVQERIPEVVREVSRRLIAINRFAQAAELYEGIDSHKDAIDVYLKGNMWDKARQLAATSAPHLVSYVDSAHKDSVKDSKKGSDLLGAGNSAGAMEVFASNGQWEECLQLAVKSGSADQSEYTAQFAKNMVDAHNYVRLLTGLAKYGAPADQALFDAYARMSREVLSKGYGCNEEHLSMVRDVLYKVVAGLGDGNAARSRFDKLLQIAHLMHLWRVFDKKEMKEQTAKVSISLVRYCNELPADMLFMEAGSASKEFGWLNMAFVFWNRYLDLSEAMEDPDSAVIENSDFENTDIPYDFTLPERQYSTEDQREKVRDWILTVSMDNQVDQEISISTCDKCHTNDMYIAGLQCKKCSQAYDPCIVTGYPVKRSTRVQCRSCHKSANRDDWNAYIGAMKNCPWCRNPQNPAF